MIGAGLHKLKEIYGLGRRVFTLRAHTIEEAVPRVSPFSTFSALDGRGPLVDRVAQSRYIAKSVRLHDLLVYLCDRVINDGALEIHEQEVGHAVFGRAKDYDTALDNIVRVHASTLRKRLEQFFAEEGRAEPLIIELPKGNYAPAFRERPFVEPPEAVKAPVIAAPVIAAPAMPAPLPRHPTLWVAVALAALFACSTVFLLWRLQMARQAPAQTVSLAPAVKEFWSEVFAPNQKTDIVLDDAALGLYQELDGRPIALSEYFDRSYLRRLGDKSGAKPLDPEIASSIVLKRQSSYSSVSLLWQFSHTAAALGSDWAVHFARDYTFREAKSNRAILLGNSRSNPWIEPFENRLGIRWNYSASTGISYPVDTWAGPAKVEQYRPRGEHPDGYCSIAMLPNPGGTGSIVLLTGTGGAAAAAAGAFLVDGDRMAQLRAKLPAGKNGQFPYFEALLKIPSRSRLPKDAEITIWRPDRK
jgi:hypothetical protein